MNLTIENIEKEKLIKYLAKKRIPIDSGINIDSLSDFVLMSLPETSIVTMVGTYCTMKYTNKIPENKIIKEMQSLRISTDDFGKPSSMEYRQEAMNDFSSTFNNPNKPPTLTDYIKYRLHIEYPITVLPESELIDEAIEKAKRIFIGKEFFCVKCNAEIYQKSDTFFRFLLIGSGGVNAFPRYYCPNCGKIPYKDLSNDLKKKIFRARIKELLILVMLITLLIIFS